MMSEIPLFFLVITTTITTFLLYVWGSQSHIFQAVSSVDTRRTVLLNRIFGFGCYGGIPFLMVTALLQQSLANYGLGFNYSPKMLYWFFASIPVMMLFAYLGNKSTEGTDMYPQIRITEWNWKLTLTNAGSWILYLTAYEFFFRGFLLSGSLAVMDKWSAIALNAGIYALMHLQKNLRETIGSLPFGAFLAIIALQTGSVWTGVAIHSTLAITNFLFAIKQNPAFRFNL